VLGVRAAMSEGELAVWVPQLVTLCAGKFTMGLVARGLPGLTLTHLPIPPGAISPRSDTQYFGIERSGRCWDLLASPQQFGLDASEIAAHVPDAIPSPELELAIVLES
jgi:type VI secretion system protein ImpJ